MDFEELPQPEQETLVPPDELETDSENPNEMSDEQFGLLCDRMRDRGWLGGAIVADSNTNLIADGEHRWMAASEIGLEQVPVKFYDLSEPERRMIRQELNKISGEHDSKRDALEYDFLLDNGMSDEVQSLTRAAGEDLDELLEEIKLQGDRPAQYDYDPEHNVYFEDCVEGMRERLDDNSVDCLITDPPYGMAFQEGSNPENHKTGDRVKAWDSIEGDQSIDDALDLLRETLSEVSRTLREGGHAYIFCDWRGIYAIHPLVEDFLNVVNVLVWDKGSMGIGDLTNNWGYSHEFIIFATKGDRPHELTEAARNVLEHPREVRTDYEHPTQKPTSLISQLVETSTTEGDLICDPFMGSGTTAVAAIQNDRDYIGFELDEENYRPVIERRIGEAKRAKESSVNNPDTAEADD